MSRQEDIQGFVEGTAENVIEFIPPTSEEIADGSLIVPTNNNGGQERIHLQKYIFGVINYGDLYRGYQHRDGGNYDRTDYAVKTIHHPTGIVDVCKEVFIKYHIEEISSIETAINHQVIIPTRIFVSQNQTNIPPENQRYYILISDWASNGDLYKYIFDERWRQSNDKEGACRHIFSQMVKTVHYLHELRIFHCDLKPENFVVDVDGDNNTRVSVIDFGKAQICDQDQLLIQTYGTECYGSPELPMMTDWKKCDVWALGIILYIMMVGEYPGFCLKIDDDGELVSAPVNVHNNIYYEYICQQHELDRLFRDNNINNFSEHAINLLQSMLIENVEERISMEDILEHPWFR